MDAQDPSRSYPKILSRPWAPLQLEIWPPQDNGTVLHMCPWRISPGILFRWYRYCERWSLPSHLKWKSRNVIGLSSPHHGPHTLLGICGFRHTREPCIQRLHTMDRNLGQLNRLNLAETESHTRNSTCASMRPTWGWTSLNFLLESKKFGSPTLKNPTPRSGSSDVRLTWSSQEPGRFGSPIPENYTPRSRYSLCGFRAPQPRENKPLLTLSLFPGTQYRHIKPGITPWKIQVDHERPT